MVRRFNSDASQVRAAYLSSLLVALFEAAVSVVSALRATATTAQLPVPQRRVSASTWGKL